MNANQQLNQKKLKQKREMRKITDVTEKLSLNAIEKLESQICNYY